MSRRIVHRVLAGGGLALLGAATAAIGPAPALADGAADLITVTGIDLAEPLEVTAEAQPERFAALYTEVDWLIGQRGDAAEPDPETIGPQYTLVVHVDSEPRHRFHLYPLAEGGPRAFRPAEQPADRTVREAWHFGRLSMSETLRAAGVPLTGAPVPAGGGAGGGEPAPTETAEADTSVLGFLDEWREGMLLTGATVVAVAAGLAGLSFLIRRKV